MTAKSKTEGKQFVRYFGPVVRALRELGGSARPAEVRDKVAQDLKIPDGKIDELLESGTSRFNNQVAWARFYLARAGYIDSSLRGVWSLTDKGRDADLDHRESLKIFREVHAEFPRPNGTSGEESGSDEVPAPEGASIAPVANHRLDLLELLQNLPPEGFERFCQRLLRESGFQDVTVTGRSGDGGIDGIGILQVNPLVSFKVLFQCKRYRGSVKYRPDFPDFFGSLRDAWTGAELSLTITTRSIIKSSWDCSLRPRSIMEQGDLHEWRRRALTDAYVSYPERFVRKTPLAG